MDMYDLIIIGAGAAGLSAAIYAGRANMKTLVVEKSDVGGQIKITSEVVNYPGVISASGAGLAGEMKKQALHFGAVFITGDVLKVDFSKDIKTVQLRTGEVYSAVGIIIATGAKPRKLGFEGEQEFAGRGIAYCATCDGEFFTGKDVFVIGAGFAAAEEAIFLTRFARKVTVIAREPAFTCSKTIADKVLAHEKIEVRFNTEIVYVRGAHVIKEAKFINNQTQEALIHKVDEGTFGVFIFVGYEPESTVFKGHVKMDEWGYIPANEDMETDVPGIYAAGDIRPKRLRQLVTATADGAIASTAAEKYIGEVKNRLGIVIENTANRGTDTKSPSVGEPASRGTDTKSTPAGEPGNRGIDNKSTSAGEPKGPPAGAFNEQVSGQIKYVMERCAEDVIICAVLQADCPLSDSIRDFLEGFRKITDRMPIRIYEKGENPGLESQVDLYPVITLLDKDENYTGVGFHGIPMGHELESFILAVYNAAGPGQAMPEALAESIKSLPPCRLKIGVSLSCTMCPELVQNCQRMAILNKGITAEMLDLQYFPELRDKFDIMSVPAMIINDTHVLFGKKSLEELVNHIR